MEKPRATLTKIIILPEPFSRNQRENNVDMILVTFTVAQMVLNGVSGTNQLFINSPAAAYHEGPWLASGVLGWAVCQEGGADLMYPDHT